MDELRDKVARIVAECIDPGPEGAWEWAQAEADRILALPEIAEALTKAKRWDEACMDALDD